MTSSRRTLLIGAGAGLLAACSSPSPRTAPRPAAVDPDVALRAEAVRRERALLAGLDRALAAVTGTPTGTLLQQLRAEHVVHLQALDPGTAVPPAPAGPTGVASPQLQAAYRRTLSGRERTTAAAHAAATATASGPLAAVLAQLAASEASHAAVL